MTPSALNAICHLGLVPLLAAVAWASPRLRRRDRTAAAAMAGLVHAQRAFHAAHGRFGSRDHLTGRAGASGFGTTVTVSTDGQTVELVVCDESVLVRERLLARCA